MPDLFMGRGLGCIQDPLDRRDFAIRMFLAADRISLPKSKMYEHPSSVRDQGALGSCVGHACAALKEFQEVQQRNRTPFRDVSEAWIYWKAKEIDPWEVFEEGTSFRYALKVLNKEGVPTEKAWPYKPINTLQGRGKPKFWAGIVARWGKIKTYARIESIPQMKETLVLKGPFLLGIMCFNGIFSPSATSAMVSMPKAGESPQGGHAILIMGYDDDLSAFWFRNSWGTHWGKDGYAWLPYQYVDQYMLDAWSVVDL